MRDSIETLISEAFSESHTPTSVIDASERRFRCSASVVPQQQATHPWTTNVEFAKGGPRPSDAVSLRQSTLLEKWKRSEKAVDFRVGNNLIGYLPNHDPSKNVTARLWVDV